MLVCTKCFRQTKIEIIEKIIKKLNLYRKKKKLRTNKHYLLARWLLLKIVFFQTLHKLHMIADLIDLRIENTLFIYIFIMKNTLCLKNVKGKEKLKLFFFSLNYIWKRSS